MEPMCFHLNQNAAGWKRGKQFSLKIAISCLCLWVQLENWSGPVTVSNVEVAI